jgi:GNAT superfamily N-acetyltransferase
MAAMTWRTTGDVAEFLDVAGAYLRRERVRNTVLLTVTEQLRVNLASDTAAGGTAAGGTAAGDTAAGGTAAGDTAAGGTADPAGQPLFGWWQGAGAGIAGAFMHTPPHPLLLTAVPADAASELAADLAGRPLSAVNAYPEAARQFAAAWRAVTGRSATPLRGMRLYRLTELAWPDPAPDGAARVAAAADVPLLADWFTAFARDVHDEVPEDAGPAVREKLGYGGISVWQADSRPVSMGAVTRQVAGMVRIGPVYTPPEFRGHGYASAVTAELSRRALDGGAAEVLLYTDLDNPVTNSIYQRIGYRAVEDRVVLTFSGPAARRS